MNHHIVMAMTDVVLKERPSGRGILEAATTTAGDHVERCVFLYGFAVADRPGAFVRMNVAVPDDVHLVLFVQGHELARAPVAVGTVIGFPKISVIIGIGRIGWMMVANEFPFCL